MPLTHQPISARPSRRAFLKIGALGLGGFTLPQLLKAEASAGIRSSQKSVILIYLVGGPPHQDMFDLKPTAPKEIIGIVGGSRHESLAIQPLPPVDGGLEILTDDGSWAHKISRGAHALTVDFVLRMRGALNEGLLEEFRAAAESDSEPMQILKADATYGAGLNHWLAVTVRATRSAQVRHWWAARGLIVSRLMRVRFGPILLARELPRGHSRAMLAGERSALVHEVDAARAARAVAADPD